MIAYCARQRGGNPTQRTARGLCIGNKFDIYRSPRRISLRGNKKLFRLQVSQDIELALPKWAIAKKNRRLVPAHTARFSAREQDRAELHSVFAATTACERRIPSVKIFARKPPRPRRNSSAPGPIAWFIQ